MATIINNPNPQEPQIYNNPPPPQNNNGTILGVMVGIVLAFLVIGFIFIAYNRPIDTLSPVSPQPGTNINLSLPAPVPTPVPIPIPTPVPTPVPTPITTP